MKEKCVDVAAPYIFSLYIGMEDDELRISPFYLVHCSKEMLNGLFVICFLFIYLKRKEKEEASLSYPVLFSRVVTDLEVHSV